MRELSLSGCWIGLTPPIRLLAGHRFWRITSKITALRLDKIAAQEEAKKRPY